MIFTHIYTPSNPPLQKMNQGAKVKVHYTGTLNDGKIFDSSDGREPLEFEIGASQVVPGFENGIKEMKLNEEKTIRIKPSEAYGEKNPELIKEIPRNKFPPEVQVGGHLILKGPEDRQIPAIVKEVKEDSVTIDFNHPLAGKELTFKVKVVGIN